MYKPDDLNQILNLIEIEEGNDQIKRLKASLEIAQKSRAIELDEIIAIESELKQRGIERDLLSLHNSPSRF